MNNEARAVTIEGRHCTISKVLMTSDLYSEPVMSIPAWFTVPLATRTLNSFGSRSFQLHDFHPEQRAILVLLQAYALLTFTSLYYIQTSISLTHSLGAPLLGVYLPGHSFFDENWILKFLHSKSNWNKTSVFQLFKFSTNYYFIQSVDRGFLNKALHFLHPGFTVVSLHPVLDSLLHSFLRCHVSVRS